MSSQVTCKVIDIQPDPPPKKVVLEMDMETARYLLAVTWACCTKGSSGERIMEVYDTLYATLVQRGYESGHFDWRVDAGPNSIRLRDKKPA